MAGSAVQTFLLSAAPRLRANKINVWAVRDGGVWRNVDVFTRRRKGAKRVLPQVFLLPHECEAERGAGDDIFAPSRLRVNTSIYTSPYWLVAILGRA